MRAPSQPVPPVFVSGSRVSGKWERRFRLSGFHRPAGMYAESAPSVCFVSGYRAVHVRLGTTTARRLFCRWGCLNTRRSRLESLRDENEHMPFYSLSREVLGVLPGHSGSGTPLQLQSQVEAPQPGLPSAV